MMGIEWWDIALLSVGGLIVFVVVITLVVMVTVPVGRGIGGALSRLWKFVKNEVLDFTRAVVGMMVAPVFGLLALVSLLFFQVASARKFGVAAREELLRSLVCLYRAAIGNPARLLGLEPALEGIETRLPGVLSGTWGDVLSPRTGMFDGYEIMGTLPSGGSGAKLYIAMPGKKKFAELLADASTHAVAQRTGAAFGATDRVVIKSFTTFEDASLPQLVRESRGLEAGKRLGLILDHGVWADRFYYVMRYVPGQHLRHVATQLHQQAKAAGPRVGEGEAQAKEAAAEGLGDPELRACLSYLSDLLVTLSQYHEQGLWHKDVKPDNIIIEPTPEDEHGAARSAGRARLVDVGLVSSLRSAMTLTTHGTEYYRDPEMVRQALRGVKVADVDGTRFDIYAAGAVLYSMVEDSFPAQGVLSPIEKRCPPSVAWIIRRAMADYRQRYASAGLMLEDVRAIATCPSMMSMRLMDLPSVRASSAAIAMRGEGESEVLGKGQDAAVLDSKNTSQMFLSTETADREIGAGLSGELALATAIVPSQTAAAFEVARPAMTGGSSAIEAMQPMPSRAARTQRLICADQTGWQRLAAPAFNAIGLPTRVKIRNWWTGACVVEE